MPAGNSRRWSGEVTRHSDALDLERDVFAQSDPKRIARSLKQSAEHSDRRKSSPFRSAMSMLTFYINRAGSKLPPVQRRRLETGQGRIARTLSPPGPQAGGLLTHRVFGIRSHGRATPCRAETNGVS